jgi:hypothetical protein
MRARDLKGRVNPEMDEFVWSVVISGGWGTKSEVFRSWQELTEKYGLGPNPIRTLCANYFDGQSISITLIGGY